MSEKERFWEAMTGSDALDDFVNEHVCVALKEIWQEHEPLIWLSESSKNPLITMVSPDMPNDDFSYGAEPYVYHFTITSLINDCCESGGSPEMLGKIADMFNDAAERLKQDLKGDSK